MVEMDKLTPLNPKPIHIATLLAEAVESAFLMDERGSTKDTIECHLGKHYTIQDNATLYYTMQDNTILHNARQHYTTQYKTTLHYTIQDNTIQRNTTQHNTTQHNTNKKNYLFLNLNPREILLYDIFIEY